MDLFITWAVCILHPRAGLLWLDFVTATYGLAAQGRISGGRKARRRMRRQNGRGVWLTVREVRYAPGRWRCASRSPTVSAAHQTLLALLCSLAVLLGN